MGNGNIQAPDEKPGDAFKAIADTMFNFRNDMEYYDGVGAGIASRTRFIMKTVFATLIVSSIYLLYMIFQMSSNMTIMTAHLEGMYGRFGTMAEDMREIASLVDSMGNSISGISMIADSMTEMDQYVSAMRGSVDGMNTSMTDIDNYMAWINRNMSEMGGRMAGMSRAVNSMSYDTNEMAKPMKSGPMSGIWPK
jgi:methyl-accepting chemotaxis protein